MIDGIANTGTHTFVEKNKIFPIDIHLHVHSHSMRVAKDRLVNVVLALSKDHT
jgi:hypothetical protein